MLCYVYQELGWKLCIQIVQSRQVRLPGVIVSITNKYQIIYHTYIDKQMHRSMDYQQNQKITHNFNKNNDHDAKVCIDQRSTAIKLKESFQHCSYSGHDTIIYDPSITLQFCGDGRVNVVIDGRNYDVVVDSFDRFEQSMRIIGKQAQIVDRILFIGLQILIVDTIKPYSSKFTTYIDILIQQYVQLRIQKSTIFQST